MKKKKLVYIALSGCLLLSGCGTGASQKTETSGTSAAAEESTEAVTSSEVTGMVQSVSDSQIVLAEGGGPGQSGGPGQGGGAPGGEKPGEGEAAPGGGKPDGENKPEGSSTTTIPLTSGTEFFNADGVSITIDEIVTGIMVTAELDDSGAALKITVKSMEGGPGGMGSGMGGPGGGQSAPESYQAVTEFKTDTEETGKTYTSTGTDENAVHISNGAAVTLKDFTVTRTSSDSTGGDSSSFYGVGAGILVSDGTAILSGGTIDTDSAGGAGIFSYDKGVVNVSGTTIHTAQDTSGGIHVAGGGTLHAENLTVSTMGESSAAVRSDRGGGTMTVKGGSYTANGVNSPAVYSTADISIEDAELTSTGAEAVCIEGLNSLKLVDCSLSGNMPENEQNDCMWTVILYQSMSGDSEVGNSTFDMEGGSLTSLNGGLFYTTNTESTFNIKNVNITNSASDEFFLKCTGNANKRGWGQSGANGADCAFTADTQEMKGDIIWDSISTLNFTMKNGSTLTGAFWQNESAAGNGGTGYASLTMDASSSWTVTGDSRLSVLKCEETILGDDGKSVSIVGTDGTVYAKGEGSYTVTVDSYQKA